MFQLTVGSSEYMDMPIVYWTDSESYTRMRDIVMRLEVVNDTAERV